MSNVDTNTLFSRQKKNPTEIVKMLELFIDNIFGEFVLCLTRQSPFVWVLIVLVYSPTFSFIRMRQTPLQDILKKIQMNLVQSFNFTFCYLDNVLPLRNSKFCDYVDGIYPTEIEVKDATDTAWSSASYLDLHIEIDSDGRLRTKHIVLEKIRISLYYTLRFYFPYLFLLAQPVTIIIVYGPVVYESARYLHYFS